MSEQVRSDSTAAALPLADTVGAPAAIDPAQAVDTASVVAAASAPSGTAISSPSWMRSTLRRIATPKAVPNLALEPVLATVREHHSRADLSTQPHGR